VSNLRLAPALVSYYTKVLKSLSLTSRSEKTRSFLASSPVKLLSSFWGGGSTNTEQTFNAPKHTRAPVAGLFPPQLPRNNSQASIFGSFRGNDGGRLALDEGRLENPLMRLEQTFTGYVASLQSRKGAIIGRSLLNRSSADELAVNDLYNRLIESPFDVDYSAELGAETIFVAFEKFIRIAWCEQMGPIITIQALNTLQERANKRVPGDFADFVNFLFGDMAPQNRRAFTAVIKLLADLLEGCGNDGDRGALTLAFAELLVPDEGAESYINLLDRLVEDCDRIFEEAGFGASVNLGGSGYGSMNSAHRSAKSYTGSLTSNTSSLRRKFGFENLLRQNSKNDTERPSVWRSLSKHSRNPATGDASLTSSLSKGSVNRSRSIDMGNPPPSPNKLRRPMSRDRPPVTGAFEELQRPASSHRLETGLETIGEPENEDAIRKTPRPKRRSSLSDLKSLMAAATLEDTPLMPLRINKQTSEKFNSTPRIPSPSRIPISPQSQSLRSPRQKENNPDPFQSLASPTKTDSPRTHSKTLSTSNIPMLKPARTTGVSANTSDSPTRPSSSPSKTSGTGKLRLQSPQKLRERLQTEKKAVDEVDASLKSELSKIAEDMARVNSGLANSGHGDSFGLRSSQTTDLRKLSSTIKSLEDRLPGMMSELHERQAAIQRDMESTLRATEAKVKAIDQLYKESMAENELLYEKFNGELGKIVKALKGKGRDDKEELVGKLKDASEETSRIKRENARLRREMASLRAALKGGD
jgi:hypothetical protein